MEVRNRLGLDFAYFSYLTSTSGVVLTGEQLDSV